MPLREATGGRYRSDQAVAGVCAHREGSAKSRLEVLAVEGVGTLTAQSMVDLVGEHRQVTDLGVQFVWRERLRAMDIPAECAVGPNAAGNRMEQWFRALDRALDSFERPVMEIPGEPEPAQRGLWC